MTATLSHLLALSIAMSAAACTSLPAVPTAATGSAGVGGGSGGKGGSGAGLAGSAGRGGGGGQSGAPAPTGTGGSAAGNAGTSGGRGGTSALGGAGGSAAGNAGTSGGQGGAVTSGAGGVGVGGSMGGAGTAGKAGTGGTAGSAAGAGGQTQIVLSFGTQSGSFSPAGTTIYAAALGDLNGDGWADLAIVGNNLNQVLLFLNNGSTPFFSTQSGQFSMQISKEKTPIALGDLNGDKRADLAFVGTNMNELSLALNGGATYFNAGISSQFSPNMTINATALGDLNGDGKADLAIVASSMNQVLLFPNQGSAPFFSAQSGQFTPGMTISAMALGDLNGDGKADFAIVASGNMNQVLLFLNNGTDNFDVTNPSAQFMPDTTIGSIALGDLNGDGKADLAIVSANMTAVELFLNTSH
jgi:hypothetical protein